MHDSTLAVALLTGEPCCRAWSKSCFIGHGTQNNQYWIEMNSVIRTTSIQDI